MSEKYTSERFISEITKVHNLKENELYSINEFNEKKTAIIIDIIKKGISQKLDDFLTDILTLKEKGVLNIDEIKQIKSSLTSKAENVTTSLPEEINYNCDNCNNKMELTTEEISKGIFICPDCSAINSIGKTSNTTQPAIILNEQIPESIPIDQTNNKQKLSTKRINPIPILYSALAIIAVIFIIITYNSNKSNTDNIKASEDARINKQKIEQSDKEYKEVKNKYKYLENRKLNSKKSTQAFAEEIKGLGFELVDRTRGLGKNYSDLKYTKTENGYTINLNITVYDNNDCIITVY